MIANAVSSTEFMLVGKAGSFHLFSKSTLKADSQA